jgi:hypothetical protein
MDGGRTDGRMSGGRTDGRMTFKKRFSAFFEDMVQKTFSALFKSYPRFI